MEKKKNNKGFTLAELLIVVAIIAVLTSIAIPVFTAQLEKSKEATDLANIRSAYAEVMAAGLTEDTDNYSKAVQLKQSTKGWVTENPICGDVDLSKTVTDLGEVVVTFDPSQEKVIISQGGSSASSSSDGD